MDSGTSSLFIPGTLVLATSALVVYQHLTSDTFDHPLMTFLVDILMSMVPLLMLKMKIYSCGDRLSLVHRVMVKTLLMHLALSVSRICCQAVTNFSMGWIQATFDIATFIVCLGVLHVGFRFDWSLRTLSEHSDVRNLVLVGLLAAWGTEAFCAYLPWEWKSASMRRSYRSGVQMDKVLFTSANYMDVLAFMPVVLKLYQAERDHDDDYGTGVTVPAEARKQVIMFFCFVVSFYAWDDVIDPIMTMGYDEPVAMMAHAAHVVLVLDFAGFFIFQVWTPSSSKGEQLQGLLESGLEQDD